MFFPSRIFLREDFPSNRSSELENPIELKKFGTFECFCEAKIWVERGATLEPVNACSTLPAGIKI
jgi:hypothetical protein